MIDPHCENFSILRQKSNLDISQRLQTRVTARDS